MAISTVAYRIEINPKITVTMIVLKFLDFKCYIVVDNR